ncbi:hypothetical protein DB347_24480 [Opitutaceae bacterium EW11]|nr:hypothetical protein DB347_24480 [Opitutaceae bacterium EW11]
MSEEGKIKWRETITVVAVIAGIFGLLVLSSSYFDRDCDVELAYLFRAGFALSYAVPSTGKVQDVSLALVPPEERKLFAKTVPKDWKRRKIAGGIEGRARLFVLAEAGGVFTITYYYSPEKEEFRVLRVVDANGKELQLSQELRTWISTQRVQRLPSRPNQSLEPTPTAVTPRAGARVPPAVGVAHH